MTGDDVSLAELAEMLRATLAGIADPDDELTAPAATRNRIEGAALALEALAGSQSTRRASIGDDPR